MPQQRPSLETGKPDNWSDQQWLAVTLFWTTSNMSYQDIADEIGVPKSTLNGWVLRWRKKWGDDFIVANHKPGFPPGADNKGRVIAGKIIPGVPYTAIRDTQALKFSAVADAAVELVNMALADYVANPEKIKQLTPAGIERLARAAALLSARGEGLALTSNAGSRPIEPGVDLSALGAGQSDENTATLDAVRLVVTQFNDSKESIPVESREAS